MSKETKSTETIERVQVGIRLEKRMIKVLKALAEYCDVTLNDLIEDMILHELEGNGANVFGKPELKVIAELKKLYKMDYDTHSSSKWRENSKSEEAKL